MDYSTFALQHTAKTRSATDAPQSPDAPRAPVSRRHRGLRVLRRGGGVLLVVTQIYGDAVLFLDFALCAETDVYTPSTLLSVTVECGARPRPRGARGRGRGARGAGGRRVQASTYHVCYTI